MEERTLVGNSDPEHFLFGIVHRMRHMGAIFHPFLKKYIEMMGWKDLNWLEDVHMGFEEDRPAVFDRNLNGWVTVPDGVELPEDQQGRDMLARELLVKFQMSPHNPLIDLTKAYSKV